MTVLILGGHDDDHATAVLTALDGRGHDAELIDSRWFPSDLRLSLDPSSGAWRVGLPTGRTLAGQDVTSVYWRRYNGVAGPGLPDPEQDYLAEDDARGLFESLLTGLPARWVNGWDAFRLHQTKPTQLARVAALGVAVPATRIGNDPAGVREFVSRHPASVFKPVQGGAHARRVTPSHLSDENLRNLALAPVTLQEEVPGTDVRVFVAGERVLAGEGLPPAVEEQSVRVARALHLLWTGIDYRLTPDGRYVFLDADPSPTFLRCVLPVMDALIGLLTGG